MFCIKCGNQLPEGARFCTACGAPVENFATPAVEEPAPAQENIYVEPGYEQENVYVEEPALVQEPPCVEESFSAGFLPEENSVPQEEPLSFPEQPEKPKKKSGKKRLLLIALAAVTVIALVVGLISLIGAASSPDAKILNAAEKSVSDLEKLMGNSGNLMAVLENLEKLEKSGETTIKYEYSMNLAFADYYSYETNVSVFASRSQKDKELLANITVENGNRFEDGDPMETSETALDVSVYANKKELIISLPEFAEDNYRLPTKNLGEELFDADLGALLKDELPRETRKVLERLDLDLFAQPNWKDFRKAYPAEVKDFEESVYIEKTDEQIPLADGDMKVYSFTCDMEALGKMLAAYEAYSLEELLGEDAVSRMGSLRDTTEELEELFKQDIDLVAYFGIAKGRLVALHMEMEREEEETSFTLLLEGKDNIWEDFVLFADGEEILVGGFEQTEDGFELFLEAEEEELTLICDDPACELILQVDGEEYVFEYGAEDGGCQIFYSLDESSEWDSSSIRFEMTLSPMEEIVAPEDAVDLLDLNEEELQELYEELGESIENFT